MYIHVKVHFFHTYNQFMMESRRIVCGVVFVLSVCLCGVTGVSAEQGSTTLQLLERIELLEKQGQEQRTRLYLQEQTVQEQQTQLHLQEKIVQGLREVVQQQDDHNTRQDARVTELQTRVSQHEQTIASLTACLRNGEEDKTTTLLSRQGDHIRSPVTTRGSVQREKRMTDAGSDTTDDVDSRSEEEVPIRHSRIVMDTSGAVAFLARMDTGKDHLGQSQNVRFDHIITNIGGGYHSSHGLFIAPVAGIYIFSTSVLSNSGKGIYVEVDIEKNGQALAGAFAMGSESGHDQGSATMVAQLAVSDEVWVMIRGPVDVSVAGWRHSSFMGCLVFPLDA